MGNDMTAVYKGIYRRTYLLSTFLPTSVPLFARNFKLAHGRLYSRKYGELIDLWKSQELEATKHKMNYVTCT